MALIAGNWKMNGLRSDMAQLDALIAAGPVAGRALLVCPPATLLAAFAARADGSHVMIGAQDCHTGISGAHTGDLSAAMLADAGASHVIVGHSERRANHGEDDRTVRAKAEAVLAAGLKAILCVGETQEERARGATLSVLSRQLSLALPPAADPGTLIIAYEPVWAIGTGLTPTPDQVVEAHAGIRAVAGPDFTVLYGGSVKPDNAAGLLALAGVGGALVGGASLRAADFLAIARAEPGDQP